MNNRSRNIIHNDGVLTELGDRVYWDKINEHTYKDLYKDSLECEHCKEKEIDIDLRKVPDNSSDIGEHMCGDLDQHKWVVLRGLKMKQETYDVINEVSKKDKVNDVTWHSIDTTESHHKMKYKTSATSTIAWKQDTLLLDFLSNIQRQILDTIFSDQQYIISKFNLLKNTDDITHYQMPHRYYQPRKG